MKKIKIMLTLVASLWMPLAVTPILIGCSGGCSAFKGAEIAEGSDPVVVHAQRTRGYALATFNTFLAWEKENRALLNNPQLKSAADTIRANYQKWDNDLASATAAYQSVRSQENASKLDTSLVLLQSGIDMARRYLLTESIKSPTN